MKLVGVAKFVPLVVAAAGLLLACQWSLSQPMTVAMAKRVPGLDGRPNVDSATVPPVDLHGTVTEGDGRAAAEPAAVGSWPNFRGPNRDNIVPDKQPLAETWPVTGPRHVWEVATGEGYAGAAVFKGRVYLMDYDQENRADVLRCLSLADGRKIWDRAYPIEIKRDHGMSRTVPAVTERFVVTMGPRCQVSCADAATGEFRWGMDLVAQYKCKVPLWYTGQCPLIDGERLILAPCGEEALLMGVDLASGNVLWKAPNPHHWKMTHSTIAAVELGGRRMYLYCASGGVVGVSAVDGRILWETSEWKLSTPVPAPLQIGSDEIFLSGGYGAGSMLLRLKAGGGEGKFEPEIVYRLPESVFGAVQQTPIYYKDFLYGVIPGGQMVCLDVSTGTPRWNSGQEKFGLGPFVICNDKIFAMNDSGTMSVMDALPAEFHLLAKWDIIEKAHESWGPIAVVDGRMLVRDLRRLICLDLR